MDLKQISRTWHDYFEYGNPHEELPWQDPYQLTPDERSAVASSLQQFQLGEGSDGRRLLRMGWDEGRATCDPYFAPALSLFIREEQRHSGYLARFMDREHIPRLSHHWLDGVFRRLRSLAGLELCIRVLVTAEIIAVPYYRALACATSSKLLSAICDRILKDEYEHLRYQASNLARLTRTRSPAVVRMVEWAHCWFLVGTVLMVWMVNAGFFRAAGYRLARLMSETLEQWSGMADELHLKPARRSAPVYVTGARP